MVRDKLKTTKEKKSTYDTEKAIADQAAAKGTYKYNEQEQKSASIFITKKNDIRRL